MTNRIESPIAGKHRRVVSGTLVGWRRRLGILCLILAATAITSPAQDEQPSTNSMKFTSLVNFDGTNGADPFVSPVQGTDGNLYGTTIFGGTYGGTVFKMTPTGTLTVLYNFCAETNCADGFNPQGLALGTDGNFYGTTGVGGNGAACPNGAEGCGTVFKITPDGTLATLYDWCSQPNCADGVNFSIAHGPLIQAADGNFYGTTDSGGANGLFFFGTVFKITPQGVLAILYSFCAETNCADGLGPLGGLIQATDGNLYGTTTGGGANGGGTVFKITPEGTLTTLYSFCSQTNCADGASPSGGLVQGADRNFYGTTEFEGAGLGGTVFKITPEGRLTTLYSFCSQTNCADGNGPFSGLVQGTDGNFYGITEFGGNSACTFPGSGCGTVFKITPDGTLTTLHSFDGTDGNTPEGLAQATNGNFYGTTACTGTAFLCFLSSGTVFSLSVALGPFVETVPTSGKVEAHVRILGTDLTGATSVRFNGKKAAFTVASAWEIKTTVPGEARTGFVTVHTPSGTLKSNVKFRVTP